MVANWQYKIIADVCSVLTDGNWIESKDQSPDGIRLIQTGNIGNGVFKDKGDKARYISEETFERLSCTEIFEGDVLVSRLPEPIGRSCILPKLEQRTVTAVDCSILRFKKDLLNKFFVYFTLSPAYDRALKNYITGSSRKRISRSNLGLIKVPVPPIEEQQRIVDELDLLTGIIDKKNAQLRDLDALAQSTFYEMFGDPNTNERGWKYKALGDACALKAGKGIKASELSEEKAAGLYPCFGGNGIRGYIAKKSHKGTYPIIGRQGALCGNVQLATGEFYATEHAVVCTPGDGLHAVFVYYALLAMNLNQYATGVAQPGLAVKTLLPIPIVIPPMELQERFAEKICNIESQIDLLNVSLEQIDILFHSRMDYYFND